MPTDEKLLIKKDLAEKTKIARTTLNGWIDEFRVFMPIVKMGQKEFFKPEVLNVIARIKELRDLSYPKDEIMRTLHNEGFAITVEDVDKEIENNIKKSVKVGKIPGLMEQTMAMVNQVHERMMDYDESLTTLTAQATSHDERLKELEVLGQQMTTKQELERVVKENAELHQKLEDLVKRVEDNENKKSWIKRIFG